MAEVFEKEFDFQRMIALKVNHSSKSLVQIETIANLKQQQDVSKMSVQETNSDFKKGKDSSTTLIERDYSDLKPEEAFKKETDSKLRKKECSSMTLIKETNSKLIKGEICPYCRKQSVTRERV